MKQNSISKMAKKSFAFLARNSRAVMTCCLMLCVSLVFADDATTTPAGGTGGDMSAADTAFTQVTTQLTGYIPLVRSLCYALAGVVALPPPRLFHCSSPLVTNLFYGPYRRQLS